MTTPARFLERWSRLKRRGASAPASDEGAGVAPDEVTSSEKDAAPADGSFPAEAGESGPRAACGADALPGSAAAASLPPIETLDLEADFTGFLKKEVGEPLRRAALRKLFSDPHFNRMDGLDTYIGDYSVATPIPPDVMKRLRQFRTFFGDEAEEDRRIAAQMEPVPGASAAESDSELRGVATKAELGTGAEGGPPASAGGPLPADGCPPAGCNTASADGDTGNARSDR